METVIKENAFESGLADLINFEVTNKSLMHPDDVKKVEGILLMARVKKLDFNKKELVYYMNAKDKWDAKALKDYTKIIEKKKINKNIDYDVSYFERLKDILNKGEQ